ncbi:MAG: hypothetical protein WEB52_00605 [Dehalococcoidia bacterium]
MSEEIVPPNEVVLELDGSEAVEAGTSRRITIRLPRSDVQQMIDYEVTDDEGNRVQSQRFRTSRGVDAIQSILEAPPSIGSGKLNVAIKVMLEGDEDALPIIFEDSFDVKA